MLTVRPLHVFAGLQLLVCGFLVQVIVLGEEYDYTLSSGALTQEKALKACKRDNKDLAMPKDADQVNKMRKYLEGAGLTHRAYVGVTDESQEDIWQWTDGTRAESLTWAKGEPNGHDHESNCIEVWVSGGIVWQNDVKCWFRRRYVCQSLAATTTEEPGSNNTVIIVIVIAVVVCSMVGIFLYLKKSHDDTGRRRRQNAEAGLYGMTLAHTEASSSSAGSFTPRSSRSRGSFRGSSRGSRGSRGTKSSSFGSRPSSRY